MNPVESYQKLFADIHEFCTRNHLSLPTIIVVSKKRSIEEIAALIGNEVKHFGENRIQEGKEKWTSLKKEHPDITLHMIGPLQRNKVLDALKIVDVFHSIDRISLIQEFLKYPSLLVTKSFFIQVNTGKEVQKSGVEEEDLAEILTFCKENNFPVKGLMVIPPVNDNPKTHFKKLRELAHQFGLEALSMGMSSDFLEAIQEGSTHVRIGSRIFESQS